MVKICPASFSSSSLYSEYCSGGNLEHIEGNYRGLGVRLKGMELRSCLANPGRRKDWVAVATVWLLLKMGFWLLGPEK